VHPPSSGSTVAVNGESPPATRTQTSVSVGGVIAYQTLVAFAGALMGKQRAGSVASRPALAKSTVSTKGNVLTAVASAQWSFDGAPMAGAAVASRTSAMGPAHGSDRRRMADAPTLRRPATIGRRSESSLQRRATAPARRRCRRSRLVVVGDDDA